MKIKWNKLTPRERDAAVAEYVMGWKPKDSWGGQKWIFNGEFVAYAENVDPYEPNNVFEPTTDHNSAAMVKALFEEVSTEKFEGEWSIGVAGPGCGGASSTSELEALCVAALRAKGIEVEV